MSSGDGCGGSSCVGDASCPHLDSLDDGATLANDSGFLVTQIDHSFPALLHRGNGGGLLLLHLLGNFYPGLLLWGRLGGGGFDGRWDRGRWADASPQMPP